MWKLFAKKPLTATPTPTVTATASAEALPTAADSEAGKAAALEAAPLTRKQKLYKIFCATCCRCCCTTTLVLFLLFLIAWGIQWSHFQRPSHSIMVVDDSCETYARSVAQVGDIVDGAAPIRCRQWDIDTGVNGYAWEVPTPRAVMLLQHGFGEYSQRFVQRHSAIITQMLAMNISVYGFDFWGHGRSQGIRLQADLQRTVDEHIVARQKVKALHPSLPLLVYGHSMGGLVSASSVARDPSGVAAVILSSPFLYDPAAFSWLYGVVRVVAFLFPGAPVPGGISEPDALTRDPDVYADFLSDPLIPKGSTPAVIGKTSIELMRTNDDGRLKNWHVPTLLFHGQADSVSPWVGSESLYNNIASTDKKLILVPDGRHELLNDLAEVAVPTLNNVTEWVRARI
jgi:acylglycerol lipase